jgi:RNA-directed DNA polymerase
MRQYQKTRIGSIELGFHFLGIDYLPTRTDDNTTVTHANDDVITPLNDDRYLSIGGG